MNLTDKTVLVTGANRGIGEAIVRELLTSGVKKVYAAARNPARLPDFADERVVPVTLEITDEAQVRDAAAIAADTDLLINNAGTAAFASLLDAPLATLKADVDVNYYGTLNVIRAFVRVLEGKAEAAIVNVVTIGAFVNFPALGGYSASKAALFSASQGIRMELAPRGIAVHTVNPGPIDTDMAKDLPMDKTSPEETARNIVAGLRDGQAEIFPDVVSQQMFEVWKKDYRELEAMVASMGGEG